MRAQSSLLIPRPGLALAVTLGLVLSLGACKRDTNQGANEPTGAADSGNTWMTPTPAPEIDCEALSECPDTPCADGQGCYSLSSCGGARCVDSAMVCQQVCGTEVCAIAESFPMQVMCDAPAPAAEPNRCQDAEAELQNEVDHITSCESDDQCGQVLQGSSCGCTRNVVARIDAQTTEYAARVQSLADLGCGGMASICDCPPADGYVCKEGRCAWNYTRG